MAPQVSSFGLAVEGAFTCARMDLCERLLLQMTTGGEGSAVNRQPRSAGDPLSAICRRSRWHGG
jgi:hypothetical protein